MELNEIKTLMDWLDASSCTSLEWKKDGETVKLSKAVQMAAALPVAAPAPAAVPAAPAPAAAAPAEAQPQGAVLKAPVAGTFYVAASPEAEPYVKAGQTVKKGQTVCLIEAMKMMNEVPAECDCVIERVLLENGALAEYGAPLFAIREL